MLKDWLIYLKICLFTTALFSGFSVFAEKYAQNFFDSVNWNSQNFEKEI